MLSNPLPPFCFFAPRLVSKAQTLRFQVNPCKYQTSWLIDKVNFCHLKESTPELAALFEKQALIFDFC